MRDILFRAKRLDNGEWVYGGLIWKEEHCCCAELPNTTYKKYYICYYDKEKGRFEDCEVDKETIGQYIGLLDIKGNKLFEGDLFLLYNRYDLWQNNPKEWELCKEIGTHCIYADIKTATFRAEYYTKGGNYMKGIPIQKYIEPNNSAQYYFEKIGNKYDNPELLKEMGK